MVFKIRRSRKVLPKDRFQAFRPLDISVNKIVLSSSLATGGMVGGAFVGGPPGALIGGMGGLAIAEKIIKDTTKRKRRAELARLRRSPELARLRRRRRR